MCLVKDPHDTFHIAEVNKICYKVLEIRSRKELGRLNKIKQRFGKEISPIELYDFQAPYFSKGKTIPDNVLTGSVCYRAEKENFYPRGGVIGEGFVHTYIRLDDATRFARTHCWNSAVFECIIPEKTEYIIDMGFSEYASRKIKFLRLVELHKTFEPKEGDPRLLKE